jgi:hypothetical protein
MGPGLAVLGDALVVLGGAMGFGSAGETPEGAGGWGAGAACDGRACITRMAKKNAAIRRKFRPFALFTGTHYTVSMSVSGRLAALGPTFTSMGPLATCQRLPAASQYLRSAIRRGMMTRFVTPASRETR